MRAAEPALGAARVARLFDSSLNVARCLFAKTHQRIIRKPSCASQGAMYIGMDSLHAVERIWAAQCADRTFNLPLILLTPLALIATAMVLIHG